MGKKRVSRKKVLAIILRGRPKSEILEEAKAMQISGALTKKELQNWMNRLNTTAK
jgi:hypothetical protein